MSTLGHLRRLAFPSVAAPALAGAACALAALAAPPPVAVLLAASALALGGLAGWRFALERGRNAGRVGSAPSAQEMALLGAMVEAETDAALLVDGEETVVLLNAPARALLGGVVAGSSLGAAVRDHQLMALVDTAREAGTQQRAEVRLAAQRRTVAAAATPLQAGSERGRVLLTLPDVTPLRQVENTRREFVTNVSHELRSPLASVKAMVETLEAGALERPEVARDFLGRINADVDRMSAMVEELLELARVESGAVRLEREPVDIAVLARDVAASFQLRAETAGVTLAVEADEAAPSADADPARVRQVLVNLVDNALRFTPSGGWVILRAGQGGGTGQVQFEVMDTGVGIAPQHLPHVFERFYKADRSRRDGGTGLGLAIVRHLVAAHGGTVSVESREGQGARFTVLLPAAPSR
jgi:two-component system phosphate regulon sensor histidine kinase PhoR